MPRTIEVDQQKLEDVKRQIAAGSPVINIGGKQFKPTDSVIRRIQTSPQSFNTLQMGSNITTETSASVPTATPPQIQGEPTPTPINRNVYVSRDTMPSHFESILRDVVADSVAKSKAPLVAGGMGAATLLRDMPENLALQEGWAGLNLEQARRLQGMETQGLDAMLGGYMGALEQKQSRLKDLMESATKAFTESRKAEAETEGLNKEQITIEQSLRKEYIDSAKNFETIRDSYGRIIASAKSPSAAGDLSMIFNYMKMLDPGSVVRESEFATAAAAGSFGEQIQGAVNKVLTGKRLSDDVRQDFVNRSNMLFEQTDKQQQQRIAEYTRLANAQGLNPSNVIVDLGLAGEQVAETTTGGDTMVVVHDADGDAYEVDLTDPNQVAELDRLRKSGEIID